MRTGEVHAQLVGERVMVLADVLLHVLGQSAEVWRIEHRAQLVAPLDRLMRVGSGPGRGSAHLVGGCFGYFRGADVGALLALTDSSSFFDLRGRARGGVL